MYRACGEEGCAGRILYREWGCTTRAGRVLYCKWSGAVLGGRVLCRLNTVRVSSCRPPATHGHRGPSSPSGTLRADGCGGFRTTRSHLGACHRRVGPSCSAIPPFGGVEAVAGADVVPKSRPARRKTQKMRRCGRGGLHFGLNGVGQGVRARRGPGSWAPR